MYYYAGDKVEKRFDDQIRKAVKRSGTKADMALYLQNQEILNLLRLFRDANGFKVMVNK